MTRAPIRVLSLAVAALALVPAAASAHTVTKTSGDVTATLSWKGNFEDTKQLRLVVDRAGTTVFDKPVKAKDCGERIPGFACPWPPLAGALALRDLTGDGEPEAVVGGFTGGAHCCLLGLVYGWDGSTYKQSEYNFFDPGYAVRDLDGDGSFEFLTRDPSLLYLYGSYAESVTPVQVISFDGRHFEDTTADFPTTVRRDARALKSEYRTRADSRKQVGVRSAIAAYIADLYTLGEKDKAKQRLQDALDAGELDRHNRFEVGPFGEKFVFNLLRELRILGYR
jgi:hypothetical protein